MRIHHLIGALIGAAMILWGLSAGAAERRIGAIAATAPTAASNTTTAVPFAVPGSSPISIQCSADAYVVISADATKAATNLEVRIAAGALFPTSTPSGPGFVSVLPVTGAATCQVFVRSGNEV